MVLTYRPSVLSYDQVRAKANAFLDDYHPSFEAPVPIEEIVEFDLSMSIIPLVGLKQEIGVDAFLTNDLNHIYLDEWVMQFAPTRARFSLAHEVAHWWLHDSLYKEATITSVAEWKELVNRIDAEAYKWFEWQANAFAGLVLVPEQSLRRAFARKSREAAQLGVPLHRLEEYPARAALGRSLAGEFDVSEQVMEIRLVKDNYLPPLRGEELW